MNADDRQLIGGIFERMQNVQGLQKDADAEAFIHECVRHNPDAAYLLVQSVLVQEHALQKADGRLKELEAKVAELENKNAQQSAAPATSNNSFIGSRSSTGFGRNNRPASAVPAAGNAPWQRAANQDQQNSANRSAGGGFMAQAMTTAAGVAGGMLLASGISSLFSSGDTATAAPADADTSADTADTGATEQLASDTPQEEPAVQDASNEDGGFFGGDDWGGGDDW
ncbi:MAG: DUF2076 domain-containing protein, partial [Pseudomonadota bacterium]